MQIKAILKLDEYMHYHLPDYFRLSPTVEHFSHDNALALAKVSQAAYEPLAEVEALATSFWDFDKISFIQNPHQDTELYVLGNQKHVVVAFRGSESAINDWNTNLSIKLKPAFQGKVHEGFYDALEGVWARLVRTLVGFCDNQQAIWLTGHSLGGALASLAAAKLHDAGISAAGLYTFGQPRVGDQFFAYWINAHLGKRYYRFVNYRDGVCKLPPKKWGFVHAGIPVNLSKGGHLLLDQEDWQSFMEDLDNSWTSFLDTAFDTHKQHSMQAYIQTIADNMP